MYTKGEKGAMKWIGRLGLTHVHYWFMYKIDNWWEPRCTAHGTQSSAVTWNGKQVQKERNTHTCGLPGGSVVKNQPEVQETQVRSLGREDPLEEGRASHSSVLAWRIPWTEEPGGLQSMRSPIVRHDWSALVHTHAYVYIKLICSF